MILWLWALLAIAWIVALCWVTVVRPRRWHAPPLRRADRVSDHWLDVHTREDR